MRTQTIIRIMRSAIPKARNAGRNLEVDPDMLEQVLNSVHPAKSGKRKPQGKAEADGEGEFGRMVSAMRVISNTPEQFDRLSRKLRDAVYGQ